MNIMPVKNLSLTIGIDASNIRGGGGVTHLVELLRGFDPEGLGITRVVVWSGTKTLQALDQAKPCRSGQRIAAKDAMAIFAAFASSSGGRL